MTTAADEMDLHQTTPKAISRSPILVLSVSHLFGQESAHLLKAAMPPTCPQHAILVLNDTTVLSLQEQLLRLLSFEERDLLREFVQP